jgi:hypothetical protein
MLSQTITAAAALAGVLVGTFGGESYRRFNDATALAAAFHGELSSIRIGLGVLSKVLDAHLAAIASGTKIPPAEVPARPLTIFDASLQKIGILGSGICKDLAFTYHMINAVHASTRTALALDDVGTRQASLKVIKPLIANAQDVMPTILESLKRRSSRRWLGLLP